ncbi:hypothetical protein BDZ94DRAFT_1249584 [Collybia nuda]|uniref:Uncharacterized protein n=1 Tax=Collybia nuda TaxID=64659 RepID=A0A9P5YD69_9AGAR|nr:hypothetical protein BDZ94DRAFT_1249584 [Collybia nuda]
MASPSSMTDYKGVCQRLYSPWEHQVRNQDIEAEVPNEKPHVAFCGGTKL